MNELVCVTPSAETTAERSSGSTRLLGIAGQYLPIMNGK